MPDTKFSWLQMREHIRKYVWIYIVGVAACLVVTNLLWTTTRPRVPDDRSVIVYLMDEFSDVTPLQAIADDMLARGQAEDEMLELVEFQSLQYKADDYASSMLLLTRLSVSEGDAFLASQDAMDALVNAQALLPLDDAVAGGWLADYGLEPYYASRSEEDGSTAPAILAGLRLDKADALLEMRAFDNRGAFLCVSASSTNPDATMQALETMIGDLMKGDGHAAAEGSEPAA